MAQRFSVSVFAAAADATPCSGSVGTVTAASVIAAPPAAPKRDSNNDAAPTAATNRVRKGAWTIATGNGSIGAGRRQRA